MSSISGFNSNFVNTNNAEPASARREGSLFARRAQRKQVEDSSFSTTKFLAKLRDEDMFGSEESRYDSEKLIEIVERYFAEALEPDEFFPEKTVDYKALAPTVISDLELVQKNHGKFPLILKKDKQERPYTIFIQSYESAYVKFLGMNKDTRVKGGTKSFSQVIHITPDSISRKALLKQKTQDFSAKQLKLSNPEDAAHFMPPYDATFSEGSHTLAIQELFDGTLLQFNPETENPLPLEQRLDIATQATKGIAILHANGLMHLDVKPDNFLVRKTDEGKIKIVVSDLDTVVGVDSPQEDRQMGATYFIPPEVKEKTPLILTQECDLYALGLTFSETLFPDVMMKDPSMRTDQEKALVILIKELLAPEKRPSAAETLSRLESLQKLQTSQ